MTTTRPSRSRFGRLKAWLPAVAVFACPIGKLLMLAGLSGSIGVAFDNPWLLGMGIAWIAGIILWRVWNIRGPHRRTRELPRATSTNQMAAPGADHLQR